ncbi:hypothetical protein ANO14919_142480 [Xylariales sp. No.14919]|nr:hypothetical protein ANO14919_142480 [Xylariales sp. No.14919]
MNPSQSLSTSAGSKRTAGAPEISQHPAKRHAKTLGSPITHLIIHEVTCSRNSPGHKTHEPNSRFLDVPCLFENDCKASALRGLIPFSHHDEYLEDHPEVSFTVIKQYDCEQYHTKIERAFEKRRLPNVGIRDASMIRPYFYVLEKTGPVAEPVSARLRITSKSLIRSLNILESQRTGRPRAAIFSDSINAPYIPLYHIREFLDSATQLLDQADVVSVQTLFGYLGDDFHNDYTEANDLFKSGRVSKKHFPKLFQSKELIVTHEDDHPVVMMSENCLYSTSGDTVELSCTRLSFNGQFIRKNAKLRVVWPSHSDTIDINLLIAYPLRLDTNGTKDRLFQRGVTFWSCRQRRFVSYTAPKRTFEIQVVNPRYMIDMETYHQSIQKDDDALNQQGTIETVDMDQDAPPTEEFTIMLPPRILGFGLHDKKWKILLVEHIHDIQWNKKAFDRLVLAKEKKRVITAIVKEHVLMDTSTDVIEGKGNGLIILLHGAPGTGKTLTAESIAEVAEKPLYRVTCGDIGTDPKDIEKYLESVLYIATMWKAVVLFDESDVFLEERTQFDLQRNALVSAFLRVLEYYDGILILTTNRVGTFDEAFKSRVQLALHYPKLDKDGRLEIWNDFIYELEKTNHISGSNGVNSEQLRTKVDVLAREELNGRQIRNAIRTGRHLASQERVPLAYDHLRTAIEVTREFDRYIVKTHGHTDDEFAKDQKIRA